MTGSPGNARTAPSRTVLMVYPAEWIERREKEWGPLSQAASDVGFDVMVASWGDLRLDGAGLRAMTGCRSRRANGGPLTAGSTAAFAPDAVLTTWGVQWGEQALFEEIRRRFRCVHTESPLLAWLDGKAELELCLREYEQATGAEVSRPRTLVGDELIDGVDTLGDDLVIVKPSRGGQCRGIRIVPSRELRAIAGDVAAGRREPVVAQRLVRDVHLYRGRRWDLRIHAMAASLEPLAVRAYREGIAKTAGAPATPGGRSLDEWLNAESHLAGRARAENLSVTAMLARLRAAGVALEGFWSRVDSLVGHLFAAVARLAGSWPPGPERAVHFAGLDLIVERRGEDDYSLRLLELNSHPGLGWDPPVAGELRNSYRDWFTDLHALCRARGDGAGPGAGGPVLDGRPAPRHVPR